jgi:hypothetical protein
MMSAVLKLALGFHAQNANYGGLANPISHIITHFQVFLG